MCHEQVRLSLAHLSDCQSVDQKWLIISLELDVKEVAIICSEDMVAQYYLGVLYR